MAWHRRYAKLFVGSNGTIDEFGFVHYYPRLKSQRTRLFREVPKRFHKEAV